MDAIGLRFRAIDARAGNFQIDAFQVAWRTAGVNAFGARGVGNFDSELSW